jgi:putative nucleotidyltransferase with HDIG domain
MSFIREKKRGHKRVNLDRARSLKDVYGRPVKERSDWLPGALLALFFAVFMVFLVQYTAFFRSGYSIGLSFYQLAGVTAVILLVFFLGAMYMNKFQREVTTSRGSLFTFGVLVLVILFFAKAFFLLSWPAYLIPVSFISIILALVYGQLFAIQVTLGLCIFIALEFKSADAAALGLSFDFKLFMVLALGAVVAIFGVSHIENRTRIIAVGIVTGITHAFTILAMSLMHDDYSGVFANNGGLLEALRGEVLRTLGLDMLFGLVNGVAVGFLLSGFLPFIERILGITTDISLIELSDQNQSILKRFFIEAPGSYHHSLIVGNLAEAASAAIGANPFLARAGSYFHDIGKITKPEYFTENESLKGSKHAKLSPAMSTLVIIAHVKDGVEIAEEMGLPPKIVDIIRTHHGTSLVEYFYAEAKKETEQEGASLDEASYRYGGPKPPFKEAGIVLLADSVEAISRTLDEPTPSRIEATVEHAVAHKLMDGQLDDSGLTITDLKRIKAAFVRVLIGIFHNRIKYPGQEEG